MQSKRLFACVSAGALAAVLTAGTAYAQTDTAAQTSPPSETENSGDDAEIVITGTLLRGTNPVGSSSIVVGSEDIVATGASSTAQLLANIPQLSTFGSRPIKQGATGTVSVVSHPELRNLLGAFAGGSPTLLLSDGHRLPNAGITQTISDVDTIAPGAIERVEIVPDGGSAIYGADAVGGVINLITRRRYDGADIDAKYGFADDYQSFDANVVVGKDWGSGSAFVTYSYLWHDALFGRDRDYVQRRNYVLDAPNDLTCDPGTVSIGAITYALPGLVAGTANRCDTGEDETFYSKQRRHSVYAGLTQQLNDHIEFHVSAYYTNRLDNADGGDLTATGTIRPTLVIGGIPTATPNPFYRSVGGANATAAQTVSVSFAPVAGRSTRQSTIFKVWGVSPEFKVDLGKDWQLRALFNYGHTTTEGIYDDVNASLFNTFVGSGAIDPYNLLNPANVVPLQSVLDWRNYGKADQELINYRAILDGPLFTIGGGDVRIALGAEYIIEDYKTQSGFGPRTTTGRTLTVGHRNVGALFGELLVPIVGEGNNFAGVHALNLSVSARYDDYSDFGGTFNPKVGLTLAPTDWITLRGNWGESFQAPSLADSLPATVGTVLPANVFFDPTRPAVNAATKLTIFMAGGGVNLLPQEAETWSVGVDISPPFVPGLALSATYYDIKFDNVIGTPPFGTPTVFYPLFTSNYILDPNGLSAAAVRAFVAPAGAQGLAAVQSFVNGQVYSVLDTRKLNLASLTTSGLDFSAHYRSDTSFGAIYGSVAGNYVFSRDSQASVGLPFTDVVDLTTRFRFKATLGAEVGKLLGQVSLSHSGGFDVPPTMANLNQTEVESFTVVDLFFQYDFEGDGLMRDLSLTLNIDNVLDQDPPALRTLVSPISAGAGYSNGSTPGRFVQIGVRKKF